VVDGWEFVSMIESAEPKPNGSEFITSKITDRKLNGDNYLQWRKIVEINLSGYGKKSRIYTWILLVLRRMSGARECCSLANC